MPNDFGTLAGTMILQEVLTTLLVQFPVLADITTDWTSKGGFLGQQITSRVIVPGVAVDFDQAVGYVESGRTAVDVNLTMTKHVHHTFAVQDIEQSKTNRNLRGELVETAAHAIGTKIVGDLFATVLAASYPQSYEVSAANFDREDFVKLRTKLSKLKVPNVGRLICVNSDYAEGPQLDSVLIANPNGSNQTATADGGMVRKISGFNVSEFTDLPNNGEKLQGIAGNKEAIVMATRVPDVPADPSEIPGRIANVTEPFSGATVQHRRYYDMKLGKLVESLTVMYGFAAGLSRAGACDRLVRIVTP